MELWLFLALLGAFLASMSGFFDNYITDHFYRGRTPQAQKVLVGPFYLLLVGAGAILGCWLAPMTKVSWPTIGLIVLSGILSSLASIPYFLALSAEEATSAMLFMQLSPIFYLVLGALFLGEQISGTHLVAFLFLLMVPVVIILMTKKRSQKTTMRAAVGFLGFIAIYSVSHLLFVVAKRAGGEELSILWAMIFYFLGKGLADTTLSLTIKKWRVRTKNVLRASKNRVLIPLLLGNSIWVGADYCVRSALVMGQMGLVAAVYDTSALIMTFILGVILTLIWPKFGRENLSWRKIVAHLVATVLAIIGILLIEQPELLIGQLGALW